MCLQQESNLSADPWFLIRECGDPYEGGNTINFGLDTVQNGSLNGKFQNAF